jgi:hypothetical protein
VGFKFTRRVRAALRTTMDEHAPSILFHPLPHALLTGHCQRYCESEEGMAYFTKFAIQYAMDDQEEEWRAEFEGKVRTSTETQRLTATALTHQAHCCAKSCRHVGVAHTY